jgi:uncharacterized PurR-regulated membrane protein YhhQ (DUF165 family)
MLNYFKTMNRRTTYVLLVAAFVILALVMNVTAVISVPFIPGIESWGIVRLDGSILQSIEITWALPLAALMMIVADLLSECFTKRQTIQAIVLGYLGGLFLSVWLIIGQAIAGNHPSNNFGLVIDNTLVAHFFPWDALGQSWRFLLAGFIAYALSNAVNTGMMWMFKAKHGEKKLTFRIIVSSIAGQIVDDILFLGLAFMPIGISLLEKSWAEIGAQIVITIILEIIIEAAIAPLTARWSRQILKQAH